MFGGQNKSGAGRRTLRERKVSTRMAVVDESTRQQAVQARLDALEADNDAADEANAPGSEDEEFVIAGEDEEDEEMEVSGKKRRKKSGGGASAKRKQTRQGGGAPRGPRTFARVLEDYMLEQPANPTHPSYLTAAAGPPKSSVARKFCSVCGNASAYTCARCGSRYCNRRCYTTHCETRCLKFMS
uniref:HIT-type domain-containing protein n=1 Tax=Chlamydomonas leiostraca TaxID=1034604 RepID=A0A7S0R3J5_9CHLO|mmetsp:Transcript_1294/g.3587  ORF Transcript_1294/g.3587 Transcript_1294/m.3587 type:complete len:185 (+) Transcript_1294:176-730(+)